MATSDDDSPFLAAVAFIDWILEDVAEVIPHDVRNRWTARLAEQFAHFAGKD